MTNPTSNFGWQMPTATDLVTDLPADFEVFGQAVDTSMADLKGGTTGQILSKATNADMDFVWIANDQGDITAVNVTSPITGGGTAGAVTVGIQSASTTQSGAVQLSDSTSTTSSILAATPTAVKSAYDLANTANTAAGTKVASVTGTAGRVSSTGGTTPVIDLSTSGVSAGTYGSASQIPAITVDAYGRVTSASQSTLSAGGITLLSTTTLSGTSTVISSINQSYQDLFVVIYGVTTNAIGNLICQPIVANYNINTVGTTRLENTVAFGGARDNDSIILTPSNPGAFANANNGYWISLTNYSSSNRGKGVSYGGSWLSNTTSFQNTIAMAGNFNTTSAITSLTFGCSGNTFTAGTVLVYGVK